MRKFDPKLLLESVRTEGNMRPFEKLLQWEREALKVTILENFTGMVRGLYEEQEMLGREVGFRRSDVEVLQELLACGRHDADVAQWRRDPLHLRAERTRTAAAEVVCGTRPKPPPGTRPLLPADCPPPDLDASLWLRRFLAVRRHKRRDGWGPARRAAFQMRTDPPRCAYPYARSRAPSEAAANQQRDVLSTQITTVRRKHMPSLANPAGGKEQGMRRPESEPTTAGRAGPEAQVD